MPGPRADGAAALLNRNKILYLGGFKNNFDRLQVDSVFIGTIDTLDPGIITWQYGSNFPGGPRARFQAYQWGNGKALVVGGSTGEDFSSTNDMWLYDADEDSWTMMPQKPTPITAYQGSVINLDDNIRMLNIAGGLTTGPQLTANNETYLDTIEVAVSVKEINGTVPQEYILAQNYPNPFNPETVLRFSIPQSSYVTLEIFNALGEKITQLVSKELAAGIYEYKWNAESATGVYPSGVYFYRLSAGDYTATNKMLLLK